MSHLTITHDAHIATVTLNRPEKKNAMTFDLFEDLAAAAETLAASDARVVILAGAGGSFSAGLDLGEMQRIATRLEWVRVEMGKTDAFGANMFQRPTHAWQRLDQPVIAAIEGVCLGAGLQLALAADFRIATPAARLSIMESKWGLIPDMGITTTLPKLLRADQAKELMMTARTLSGTEAHEIGLITRLADDPMAAARDFAETLAQRSPDALAGCKRLVEQAWDGGLSLEGELQAALIGQHNQIEAVMSNMQKRPPRYKSRNGDQS